jgi:hypothetical protein
VKFVIPCEPFEPVKKDTPYRLVILNEEGVVLELTKPLKN